MQASPPRLEVGVHCTISNIFSREVSSPVYDMQTYNKLATQISLPPSYIALEDTGKISGTIWTEEVVLHSTTAASKSGEAMQRKMAQPFEAKHQGNQLPVPLVPIIGKGVIEEEVMVSFVATNGEPTTMATSKLVWWNLVEQMMMTPTSCTSVATLPTRTRAPPSRALYKSGSIIVLGKTDFLRPDMVQFLPRLLIYTAYHF
ncbi:hypothetical protein ZEAMMB73_Zm00001d031352 [Zea mays]|uniref:Uncharacterized protein n=1 Tax=Zea mays TaxID=4577 RepID=A0A1D6KIF2_MAIZE|nr:hypothetical protein ZEAMMB73_Zm00001d031352 [Zea mays]ONM02766.1 hypothetical protein ZEAMMB73_Zm00001d031352 [Zea mays]ONM02767.1 hypothetical protein ZEAMMB73_Zm00001d031352 [Zea mays]ONM02768.1 hypothetical protein ZEAMMB73_Zm00001d031352 [Zea mays]